MTLSISKWNLYRMFCVWSSLGSGWLLLDIKDAYYFVPIHEEYQKYLKFLWEYPLKFIAVPNGYGPALRTFTKLKKPPSKYDSFTKCAEIVIRTIETLESLGFYVR